MFKNKLKVLFLSFGTENTPSTKFRILQYLKLFESDGINCTLAQAKDFRDYESLKDYDAVVLQKTLLPFGAVHKIRHFAKRLLYDIDDLIWLTPGRKHSLTTRLRNEIRLRKIIVCSDLCMAPNKVIQNQLASRRAKCEIVPMAIDTSLWRASKKRENPITIGWSGSPHNLSFLEKIIPHLVKVQNTYPDCLLCIHSGKNPEITNLKYKYIPFEPGREHDVVSQFHIGLLPLPEDDFACGKSPIKALQYMSCNVATLASPVGATCELITDGVNGLWVNNEKEWEYKLDTLLSNGDLRKKLAETGRISVCNNYDVSLVYKQLLKCILGSQVIK